MWFIKQNLSVMSPCEGEVQELKVLDDGVFSEKLLGDGVAVKPKGDVVNIYAPCDGNLETVFETAHAYGIATKNTKILIHIGIDTVNLKGKGLKSFVKQGDSVKQGDLLASVDIKAISTLVPSTDVIVLVLPESNKKTIIDLKLGQAKTGDLMFKVK
ncbi:glucose-specific phosphotransferase enzyme IIA component [Mycoplasmopsis californica]|uniref:PTS glucose transporter subunit IIA n=1 Tax=Mycoplasmopsis equigenitalium TaxID=114883 RepID=A0ABY5J4G5_9BACT|nr:PTS glucose transporter subunit IIA [Mycoplasmopsis equigenitalium]UUD37027.1 PTS glucose transporter subunit IIA [Mycoplasmopsis equigenitalium]VEU69674.1 glucose-specific phosphotransferase enzyme IIA component [Mycoplasmopsis californica]